jgi:hypothetical protein
MSEQPEPTPRTSIVRTYLFGSVLILVVIGYAVFYDLEIVRQAGGKPGLMPHLNWDYHRYLGNATLTPAMVIGIGIARIVAALACYNGAVWVVRRAKTPWGKVAAGLIVLLVIYLCATFLLGRGR